jgi:hypothetical protein
VLGRLRAASAGDALVGALNDPSELVQQYATEALGLIRNDRAVQALTDRVNYYRQGTMANAALLALARIAHPSSRDLFRARLADPDPAARRAAVEGVARIGDRVSLERVRTLAQSDSSSEVRLAALFGLDRLGESQMTGIMQSLGQPISGAQARDYLLETGPAAAPAVASAVATTADPAARALLIHLLGFIGGAAETRALEPLVSAPDPRVARAAANALARLRDVLDDPLFVRATGGVEPAIKAREMITPVREALGLIKQQHRNPYAIEPELLQRNGEFWRKNRESSHLELKFISLYDSAFTGLVGATSWPMRRGVRLRLWF